MNKAKLLLAGALSAALPSVGAYEVTTHAQITYAAYLRSVMNAATTTGANLYRNLGITPLVYSPLPGTLDLLILEDAFGMEYFHRRGTNNHLVSADPYEQAIIRRIPDPSSLRISGWLMRGVIREDDTPVGDNPDDDPYSSKLGKFRVFNHFFDPVRQIALTAGGYTPGDKNPDWALGVDDAFDYPPMEKAERGNHYTALDARETMYLAMTLLRKDGSSEKTTPAADEKLRKAYWATTFRSLGDVIHLNQDMAQPQHTRNEAHSGLGKGIGVTLALTGHESVIEYYTNAKATGATYSIDGQRPVKYAPLDFGNYPIPRFRTLPEYWSTAQGAGSYTGSGLANYSNVNFFTSEFNLNNNVHARPLVDPAEYGEPVTTVGTGSTKYLVGQARDMLTGEVDPIRMARKSLWSGFGSMRKWVLDRHTYDDHTRLLLPRAVAYSTGILDYFFRGKLVVSLPTEGLYAIVDHSAEEASSPNTGGFKKIKVKLENWTPDTNGAPEDMAPNGQLRAVVKFRRNTCYQPGLLAGQPGAPAYSAACHTEPEEILVSDPIDSTPQININEGQQASFTFEKAIPINATDVWLQVVFRGKLGSEEDAVVAGAKDISEPTFLLLDNSSDCEEDPETHVYSKVDGNDASFDLYFEGSVIAAVQTGILRPGTFGRVAFLTDNYNYRYRTDTGDNIGTTTVNQKLFVQDDVTNPTPYGKFRNTADGPIYAHWTYGIHRATQPFKCHAIGSALKPLERINFE